MNHPLHSKAAWIKLILALVVAVFGILTQFDVTINQEVGGPEVQLVKTEGALIQTDRDGKLSQAECLGLEKHAGENWQMFVDTFGIPAEGGGSERGEPLEFPLSGKDHTMRCTLYFDYDDQLESVSMDLWVNRDEIGPFG